MTSPHVSAATSSAAPAGAAPEHADAGLPSHRRRFFAWNPGVDTALAAASLAIIWLGYYLGAGRGMPVALYGAILVGGTLIPVWCVFGLLRGRWADLGITRRRLVASLLLAAFMGAGSAFQVFRLAAEAGVAPLPHLAANVVVFWEPFLLAWLYLRWEKAFGIVAACLLVGIGFTLQHLGSVPVEAAVGFGIFAVFFAILFATTRNLAILWPLFYGVASSIGTLQAGFHMGWGEAVWGLGLMLVQFAILAGGAAWLRGRAARPQPPAV